MKKRSIALLVLALAFSLAWSADGPTLLLRTTRRNAGDREALTTAGFRVVYETRSGLFLEGVESDLPRLAKAGFEVQIIDRQADTNDFWQVGLRPDSERAQIHSLGTVVFAEQNWLLLRVPRGLSPTALQAARVRVSILPHEPLALPVPATLPFSAVERLSGAKGADPFIRQIVDQVSPTEINRYWSDLAQNSPTGTRYSKAQGGKDATTYCKNQLEAAHLPAENQNYRTGYAPNVIGTHRGALTPERVYIVIGHVDDLPSSGKAPGADDNASGAVTVLESARVMACYAYRSTIKFITCTGEEQGLVGSDAYARDAKARGEDIRGVINMDMTGWAGDGKPNPEDLDLICNDQSMAIGQLLARCAADYQTGFPVNAVNCPEDTGSDHSSFWQQGYPAVFGITDDEDYCGLPGNYPHYHRSTDTIANCGNKAFFYSTIKTTVAAAAHLAEPFKITFAETSVPVDQPLHLVLGDRDLDTDAGRVETVVVEVSSTTETAPESFTLTEDSLHSMLFRGTVPTSSQPAVPGDGKISVAPGDTITARYLDARDCNGALNVSFQATAKAECSSLLPGEVPGLVVSRPAAIHLEWAAGTRTVRYDVAGGTLSALRRDNGFAAAECLQQGLTARAWDDTRTGPGSGDGFYYLVRGADTCGVGSYGWCSNGTERQITACP